MMMIALPSPFPPDRRQTGGSATASLFPHLSFRQIAVKIWGNLRQMSNTEDERILVAVGSFLSTAGRWLHCWLDPLCRCRSGMAKSSWLACCACSVSNGRAGTNARWQKARTHPRSGFHGRALTPTVSCPHESRRSGTSSGPRRRDHGQGFLEAVAKPVGLATVTEPGRPSDRRSDG